jgi:hypothetical protein
VPKENLIINNNVLSGVTSLSSKTILHIPKDVTTISANAFSKNKLDGITQVEFPSDSNCVTISSYAFAENSTIANIVLSPNITNLGESCFMLCSSLQELDFSKNQKITNLPKWVGAHSSNLKTLILPPNCITISNEAFEDSLGLTGNLIIPRSVTTIGEEAFLNAGYNGQGIALFFENNSTLKSVAYASFAVMKCTGTLNLPSSLKTYANNSFNSNMADLIIVNSSSGNTFGTNVLDGTKAKSLHLNIDNYFAYPKDFLSFSYIKENADGKIYVPNSLLDDFKSG